MTFVCVCVWGGVEVEEGVEVTEGGGGCQLPRAG